MGELRERQTNMTDYQESERRQFGDPDKRTGIYASRCRHGVRWEYPCRECDLVSARDFVQRWGALVDEARAKIAEADRQTTEQKEITA